MLVAAKINYFKAIQVTGAKFLLFVVLTLIINAFIKAFQWEHRLIPESYIALMSSALGIFLGFRINAAYTRWRDGHGLFRDLTALCLSLMPQITILSNTPRAAVLNQYKYQLAYLLLQYVHLVRLELTEKEPTDWQSVLRSYSFDNQALFPETLIQELLSKQRKGSYILGQLSLWLYQNNHASALSLTTTTELATAVQQVIITEQTMVMLKNTPFPWGYQFYTRLFVWLLPFFFMISSFNQLSLSSNMVMAFITTLFITTEQIATNLDDPITNNYNGVPFHYFCRMLEIELLEHLGIAHKLSFVKPVKGILH